MHFNPLTLHSNYVTHFKEIQFYKKNKINPPDSIRVITNISQWGRWILGIFYKAIWEQTVGANPETNVGIIYPSWESFGNIYRTMSWIELNSFLTSRPEFLPHPLQVFWMKENIIMHFQINLGFKGFTSAFEIILTFHK